jgi:hypothetical protein
MREIEQLDPQRSTVRSLRGCRSAFFWQAGHAGWYDRPCEGEE